MTTIGYGFIEATTSNGRKCSISIDQISAIEVGADGKTHIKVRNGGNTDYTAFSDLSHAQIMTQISSEEARIIKALITEFIRQAPGMGGGG